jgi:hypothetical protein
VRHPRSQFYAYDLKADCISADKRVAPTGNWLNEDMYSGMVRRHAKGKLNPGIVFFDSMKMPRRGAPEMAKIMAWLSKFENLALVANFILHRRFHTPVKPDTIFSELSQSDQYVYALERGWKTDGRAYEYQGNHASMATIVYVKM